MASSLEETKMKAQEGEAIVEEEETFSYAYAVGNFKPRCQAVAEIAAQICTNNTESPTMLDRIVRLLASYSALNCSVVDDTHGVGSPQMVYSLAPVSKFLVRDAVGASLGPLMAMFQGKIYLDS
ncbi:Caffeic acid O-methyltransferase [Quillaja saponaria]|uniref:Caffeic acid O-methyltransferase n=1 Tax=Quillaja saponaria TaxID=32244 RepID=A0AAD7L4I0_QUISA|nr:Caffeic acid O-methyltransferase [Quillaja saponaria]